MINIMKKSLSIVLGVILTLGAVALTSSCKKDIDNAGSLVGTVWLCLDGLDSYEMTFPTATEFKVFRNNDGKSVKGVFIITGNKPTLTGSTITLTPNGSWMDGDLLPLTGKFETETKLVVNDDGDKLTFVKTLLQ